MATPPPVISARNLRLTLGDGPAAVEILRGIDLDIAPGEAITDLLFARRAETGATLIVITHDPALAERCGRVLTMADGRIASDRATN